MNIGFKQMKKNLYERDGNSGCQYLDLSSRCSASTVVYLLLAQGRDLIDKKTSPVPPLGSRKKGHDLEPHTSQTHAYKHITEHTGASVTQHPWDHKPTLLS